MTIKYGLWKIKHYDRKIDTFVTRYFCHSPRLRKRLYTLLYFISTMYFTLWITMPKYEKHGFIYFPSEYLHNTLNNMYFII